MCDIVVRQVGWSSKMDWRGKLHVFTIGNSMAIEICEGNF